VQRLAQLDQELGDVADLRRQLGRPIVPARVAGEQLRVLLHGRTTPGDVRHDRVDAGTLKGGDDPPRLPDGLPLPAGVAGQRAATALAPGHHNLAAL
jgi:hypothetical protein